MKLAAVILLLLIPSHLTSQTNDRPATSQKPQRSAPSKKPVEPQRGEVAGFVFAIALNGDLKPARLAHIVMLYLCPNGLASDQIFPESAAMQYTRDGFTTQGEMNIENAKSPIHAPFLCPRIIRTKTDAMKMAMGWASKENKAAQVISTDADEEGYFKISEIPPGVYTLIATGQAGSNQAFWETNSVSVLAGQTLSVKMSTPQNSCPLIP
jgi:hypothetical protein